MLLQHGRSIFWMKSRIVLCAQRNLSKEVGRVERSRYFIGLREKLGEGRLAHFDCLGREGQLSIRSRLLGLDSRFVSARTQLRRRKCMDTLPQRLPVIDGNLGSILSLTSSKNRQEGIRCRICDLKLASL